MDVAISPTLDFQPRTRIVFGAGAIERLGEIVRQYGGTRVLLVTDPGIVAAGHAQRAQRLLAAAGVHLARFDRVVENPTTGVVEDCAAVARRERVDFLVGLGGGSSMDTAKGCNFLITNGGRMEDYWGIGKATRPMLPLVAIPTTAGTGSECQSFALITHPQAHVKMACGDPKAAARAAILDPELTLTQPLSVAAATGMDALSHAIETAVTRKRNPISQMLSREAFRLCVRGLRKIFAHAPEHRRTVAASHVAGGPTGLDDGILPQSPCTHERPGIQARADVLLGAALAGMAIENSMLGAAHAAANPLTARLGLVHGHAVGLMLPAVVRFNARIRRLHGSITSWRCKAAWSRPEPATVFRQGKRSPGSSSVFGGTPGCRNRSPASTFLTARWRRWLRKRPGNGRENSTLVPSAKENSSIYIGKR